MEKLQKATVAVALSLESIDTLDKLCASEKRNRSQQVDYLIQEAGKK